MAVDAGKINVDSGHILEVYEAMNLYVMFGAWLLISSQMCCQKSKDQDKSDEGCWMKIVEEILS